MPKVIPPDYVSKNKKPSDFDDFWNGVLEEASKIPLDAETIPDPLRTSDEIETFQVF